MSYENIIFKVEDSIATVTFNRPKALNALNSELINEFSNAIDQVALNEDIRVLILTGAGDKSFIAGADVKELATLNPLQARHFSETTHKILFQLEQLPIPVIAAVNGFALGGGSEVALCCDFIYASENAKFGLPEIKLGIIPGFGGTQRLSRLVGVNMAKELIFTGNMISAKEAKEIGMVNKIFPGQSLMEEVINTAKSIVSKGKVSMRAAKHAISSGLDVDLSSGCKIEIDSFALCMSSKDAKEGTTAFIEKRDAVFKGSLNK
jgi:enoyl-CoA hydratase